MQAGHLSNEKSGIKLLATDLDGTLVGNAADLPHYPRFRDQLNELRRRYGTAWVVCTGRSKRSFDGFFAPLKMVGIRPDFVIVRHAYIYGITSFGFYIPHVFWNLHLAWILRRKRILLARWLKKWHSAVRHLAHGALTLLLEEDRLWMKFESEQSAETVANLLRENAASLDNVRVDRMGLDVEVYAMPYTKGMAVAELAAHLGVEREQILAVGNGHNDISMLDGGVAGMTGCPANSEREVMEVVQRTGGHISDRNSIEGLLDAIEAHISGRVRSELPAWRQIAGDRNGGGPRKPKRRAARPSRAAGVGLALAATYAVILAFASANLIPFSGFLMKPYWIVLSLLEKLVVAAGSW